MAWRKSELKELPTEGRVVERYEWSRKPGGELHFTRRVFPVIALAEEVDGSRSRTTYVVIANDLGETSTMYPYKAIESDQYSLRDSDDPPERGGLLIIAVDPKNRDAADSLIAEWKEDTKEWVDKRHEEFWNSPKGKARSALFDQ